MLYNKPVLAKEHIYYASRYLEVFVLDDKDCYNIHVLDDKYKTDEMNTLKRQEHKDSVNLEDIIKPMQLECYALEHALWDKYYGYEGKGYSFNVEVAEEYELWE